ncbi:MAG TPA: type IV pilus secretin PilQ [Thermoanaerobaculia bacterium]|jgi:type IV pilus assembly protein PilQ
MRRAKRILLIAGVLLLSVSAAHAKLWGSRKNATPAAAAPAAPAASAMSLTGIAVEGSSVVLRTSAAPAYTSYSPAPGVFVVDLSGTSREAGVAVPSNLPPAVTSITAEEAVEMGSRLTRVTFRLAESLRPDVTAADKSVVVTIPATAIPITEAPAAAPVEVLPSAVPSAPAATTGVEPVNEPVVEVPEPPAPKSEEIVLPRARTVRSIEATAAAGNVEVRISGDGALKYKAFRLENPSRLVIDLDGVKNAGAKSAVAVDDELVRRVRVGQFQSVPPVARVVIDLAHKSEYTINADGDMLRVAFGGAAPLVTRKSEPAQTTIAVVDSTPVESKPAEVKPAEVKPVEVKKAAASKPAPKAAVADIPSQVPTVVENETWKMPEPPARKEPVSKGARPVINAPAPQTPPPTVTPRATQTITNEDVFQDAQPAVRPATQSVGNVQTLAGQRTLSGGPRVFTGEPISLNLKDADIRDVLRTFAELTGLNMAIDPGVGGAVTVDFVDVPWDQALDLILRQNNLTFTLEGNVMRIGTFDRIAAETAASRRLAEEERLNVPLTTLSFKLSYARAPEVANLLRDIASPRARIIVDPRTNQLIISEIPQYLQTMQNLITTVDIPTRQVMIEARVVESSRTFSQQWGFSWGFEGDLDPALGTGTGLVFPNRVGFKGGPFAFTGGAAQILGVTLSDVLGTFDLNFALHAAEAQGYIKVVSAPRVTTQDNQSAEIQSGFQIPYQTRINFTTTVQYLDATLRLSVTPQITEAGTVIMEISVQKNEPAVGLSIEGASGTPLTTRQARTRLMVRDGGTAVIAGIFQTKDNDAITRVPFVHNIPVIGALFRSHNIITSHDELLIFITPRIVRG